MQKPVAVIHRQIWRESGMSAGDRAIPEETAVALAYNGGTYAVMMATPRDLEDFAIGFSLNEGIIDGPADIETFEAVPSEEGIELRIWLAKPHAERLAARRRHFAGPTGCGLCGIDSIAEAMRPAAMVGEGRHFTPRQIMSAMQAMPSLQTLNIETRAMHAAMFWEPSRGVVAIREDVGRHNALDKLAGVLIRDGVAAGDGIVVLSSRVSVEMVQKAARIGAATLVSVSAPTALAVRMAEASGITLVAIARADGFEVFTHAGRISPSEAIDVA